MLVGIVRAVHNAIEAAGIPGKDCRGLSIGGVMHNLLALDNHGTSVTGVII